MSTDYVIKIIGLANGFPSEAAYQYVASYDPSGHGGRGALVVTPWLAKAKRYADAGAATEDWRRVSETHPLRDDGEPNRPMTAFSVEISKVGGDDG